MQDFGEIMCLLFLLISTWGPKIRFQQSKQQSMQRKLTALTFKFWQESIDGTPARMLEFMPEPRKH